jgi:hypothetical protein
VLWQFQLYCQNATSVVRATGALNTSSSSRGVSIITKVEPWNTSFSSPDTMARNSLKSLKLVKINRWCQRTTYSTAVVERFKRQHPRRYKCMLQRFEGEQTSGRSGATNWPKIAKINTWGCCGWTGRAIHKWQKREALVVSGTSCWGDEDRALQIDAYVEILVKK